MDGPPIDLQPECLREQTILASLPALAFDELHSNSVVAPLDSFDLRYWKDERHIYETAKKLLRFSRFLAIETNQPELWASRLQRAEVIEFLFSDVFVHDSGRTQ